MKTLFDAIKSYIESQPIRFHVPGHKGKLKLEKYDLTEIPKLDSLYSSCNCIKNLETEIGELYECKSIISVGGSTLCIQAMIASSLKPGEKIVIDRHIHISVLNALILLNADPIWVYRKHSTQAPFGQPIEEKQLDLTLKTNKDAKCVFITGEDYYGMAPNIPALAGVCKKYGAKLLVDNAHGAYLKFLPKNKHPIHLGADLCCDSWHKTFPALTGAAVLNMTEQFNENYVKQRMQMFGSSSPSYLTMLSIDRCLAYLKSNFSRDLSVLLPKLTQLKNKLIKLGFEILNCEENSLKLTISSLNLGLTGFELAAHLTNRNIHSEYCDHNCVVFMVGPQNSPEDFCRLTEALKEIKPKIAQTKVNYSLRQKLVSQEKISAASFMNFTPTLIEESEKMMAAGPAVVMCPPCVPIIMPGEIVTQEVIHVLKVCKYKLINAWRVNL
ncbi:MAG: aminotransferase class I/II-fold pyridoxal phosphate-dependent enzyme [Oscillospiraceae bacterium]|jgi:arginine/lysine/ornithine decarboxylase|nr:aminotransferase class I/II-fold pyridoxal phosphate-dependent enzyme [Oscillospiraceae bacterium]